jgi:hypothetical protein
MDKAAAKRYLKSRKMWTDREGVDYFLLAWEKIRADHPDTPEVELLAGMDLDHNDQWVFERGDHR